MKVALVADSDGQVLPVMEHFYTIQGEGAFAGHAAYFIRLAGCDVGCFWCDVPDSWERFGHPLMTVSELSALVRESGSDRVVITGGEPAMHNLGPLTEAIAELGVRLHIETSGVHALTGQWDYVCFSPKKFKPALPEVAALANELKVIIFNASDFGFAEQHRLTVSSKCALFLQPEWNRSDDMIPRILNYVRSRPEWRLGLQMHKYIGVP